MFFMGRSLQPTVAMDTNWSGNQHHVSAAANAGRHSVSLFGFKTPIPYPFGVERTGYLVTNIDEAIDLANPS
jgi:hypothetical protein